MNAKVGRWLHALRVGFVQVWGRYPVELLLTVYACVGCLVVYESDGEDFLPKLALAPLFAVLAQVVNRLAGTGAWRRIYYVCWLPIVPLSLWSGLDVWMGSLSSLLTFGTLVPLALLMCRRVAVNDRFVCDVIAWLRSGALALLFANVALGLFCAILYSTTYIFGLEGVWIEHTAIYAVILAETLVVPVLLLMMVDRWLGTEFAGSRIVDVMLNYIVTPALLIYTAILYLYMAKIVAAWSLPQGGVAYLVFWFTLLAVGVRALQFLLHKRLYDWFFDHFSLIALPIQVLFWVGVVHRTNEYGLTTMRVLLVVCGVLMTLCVVLFLARRAGRYLYLCAAGFVSFAAIIFVPALQPEQLAVRSQVRRAERAAERLQLLDGDGKLLVGSIRADTAQFADYRRLYESLEYVARNDKAAFDRFGIAREALDNLLPDAGIEEQRVFIALEHGRCTANVGEYKVLYSNLRGSTDAPGPHYCFRNDTLRIDFAGGRPEFVISGADLLQSQLQKINAGPNPNNTTLEAATRELLTYSDDQLQILFFNMRLERTDSLLRLSGVSVDVVLTR